MLIKSPVVALAFIWSISLAGQDSLIYKVEYICETKIEKGKTQDGLNTLYFTGDKSLYIHNEFPTESRWAGESGDPNRRVFHYIQGDSEGLPVYMDFTSDSMTYKSEYGNAHINFIFTEAIPKIDWKILDLESKIGGYSARLAVGDFGGRTYQVYFTEEIPIPLGPYKLTGLPGLILEVFSVDEMVKYWFKSFQIVKKVDVEIASPTDGINITKEGFKKMLIEKLLSVESRGNVTNNNPPSDWEIEKDKWTILGDYKKERAEKRKKKK